MPKLRHIKFLLDESVEFRIATDLRNRDFDVVTIAEEFPSVPDQQVLHIAYRQKRILITNDKGFGKLIFKENQKSYGVIFIRMPFSTVEEKIVRVQKVLSSKVKVSDLPQLFTTVTVKRIKSKRLPTKEEN